MGLGYLPNSSISDDREDLGKNLLRRRVLPWESSVQSSYDHVAIKSHLTGAVTCRNKCKKLLNTFLTITVIYIVALWFSDRLIMQKETSLTL